MGYIGKAADQLKNWNMHGVFLIGGDCRGLNSGRYRG